MVPGTQNGRAATGGGKEVDDEGRMREDAEARRTVPIDSSLTVVRGSEHVEAEMGGQTVMMSIARGRYFALEGTAQRIWQLMAEPVAVGEIVDRLVEEYDIDRATCEAEVSAFLAELIENGLAEAREG